MPNRVNFEQFCLIRRGATHIKPSWHLVRPGSTMSNHTPRAYRLGRPGATYKTKFQLRRAAACSHMRSTTRAIATFPTNSPKIEEDWRTSRSSGQIGSSHRVCRANSGLITSIIYVKVVFQSLKVCLNLCVEKFSKTLRNHPKFLKKRWHDLGFGLASCIDSVIIVAEMVDLIICDLFSNSWRYATTFMRFLLAANILASRRALRSDLSAILFVVDLEPNHTHRAHASLWFGAAQHGKNFSL